MNLIQGWRRFRYGLPATKADIDKIMAKLDDVLQDIADETTLEDSILALLTTIKQQLADALAGATLPPDVQAKIDVAFASLEANKAKLSAAVAANTPIAPPPATP